jgi:glyoxylase-like metal-dependent hydrolase (beta-lactamase superfamily II)
MFIEGITFEDIEPHKHWLSPQFIDSETADFRLSQHAWLIEANGKRIVVDPCVGHRRHRPLLPFYHMIDSPLLEQLEALGVSPAGVDYVFCTHLHPDHVGWNTQLRDGRHVPTFRNARYLIPRVEDEYWRRELTGELPDVERYNAGVDTECVQPIVEAGLADLIEEGIRIADCLTLIKAAGHTIGHMAGLLESAGQGAVLAGDAIHHPLQVLYPDRHMQAFNVEQAQITRRNQVDLCVEEGYWLAPAHFRPPHLRKVSKSDGKYRMEWA